MAVKREGGGRGGGREGGRKREREREGERERGRAREREEYLSRINKPRSAAIWYPNLAMIVRMRLGGVPLPAS